MLRKILMVAVVLSLFVFPASASAQRFAPLNYCTTVSAVREQGLTTYAVNATGSGRWARIVEYPVASPAVVIAVQDFGAGATSYFFQHVALSPSHQYQVQISHTSATAGFSTSGCVFAPAPLLNQLSLQVTCIPAPSGVLIEWQMTSQVGVFHFVGEQNGHEIFDIPANCPGCMTGAEYSYLHVTNTPNGSYRVRTGVEAQVIDVVCAVPTAVRLSRFSAQ